MTAVSLRERLARLPGEAAATLAADSFLCAFDGFAQLAGNKSYLSWLGRRLQEIYKAKPDLTYGAMAAHADRLLHDDTWHQEGYELAYQLLIEPFCLIENYEKYEQTEPFGPAENLK